MQRRIFQVLLLVIMVSSTVVLAQNNSLRPSFSKPVPSGPLCVMLFKKQHYVIEHQLVDSLVNPKTINSLVIEKDARATALYGARAANGLVLMVMEDKLADKEYKRLAPFLVKF